MTNYYNKDLYKILNVNYDSSVEEIKLNYRKLVMTCHPDVSKNPNDEVKFKEIQEAYEILTDNEKRKKYDIISGYYREKIKKDYENKLNEAKVKYNGSESKKQKNNDKSFSNSINSALDNLFYGKKLSKEQKAQKPQINGEDIKIDVSVSFFEAINGTNRKVNIIHTRPCPNCEGRKFINGQQCPMCKGEGILTYNKKINVKIPPGVQNGSKVRVKNEGNLGQNGGKSGDLYLIVSVEKNSFYTIDKNDILLSLPITPFEAVLGTEINIVLPDGNVLLKIPKMSSSGQKLKLAGQGLYNKTKTKKGDVIITLLIKLPKKISEKEKELYSKLSELSSEDIRADLSNAK